MKKLILTLVGIALVITAVANQNPFKKSKERAEHKQKLTSSKPYKYLTSSANMNVPTLVKNSSWDLNTSSWIPGSANGFIYQNDLMTTAYFMTYNLSDTMMRNIYTYNPDKKMTSYLTEYKTSPGVYIPNYRYTFTYSNNYQKEVVLGEMYDSQTQSWTPDARYTSEYNSRGYETKYISEMYSNGQWQISFGYSGVITFINVNSNKYLEIIDSTYNTNSMAFEPDYKETRVYNGNEEVIHITYSGNNNGSFGIEARDSILYTSGIPSRLVQYEYNIMSSAFDKKYKLDELTWDGFDPLADLFDNQPANYKVSIWVNQAWEYASRNTFVKLDNYGSRSTLTENYVNNTWEPEYRSKELYDSQYNNIEYTDEGYDTQSSTWNIEYSFKYLYQYDMNNNPIERVSEFFNTGSNIYEKQSKIEYLNYISIASGFNISKNTIETKLYPNPSNNGKVFVNVKMEKSSDLKIEILDLNGKVISSQAQNLGMGMNTIELGGLNHGLYFVVLTSDFGVSRTKLIVK